MNFWNHYYETEKEALRETQTPMPLAFWFIQERRAGRPFTEEERDIYRHLYFQAIIELQYKKMEALANAGILPDCKMTRLYFAHASTRVLARQDWQRNF